MKKNDEKDVEMIEYQNTEDKVVKVFEKVLGAQLTIEDKIMIGQKLQVERKRKRFSGDKGSKTIVEVMGRKERMIMVPKLKVKIVQKMIGGLSGSKYAHNIPKRDDKREEKDKEKKWVSRIAPAIVPKGPKGNKAMKGKASKGE
jgi:hypothetical protein